ncbi:MAG: hypothetical protein QXG57_05990 [Thermofilaceae archaeon]
MQEEELVEEENFFIRKVTVRTDNYPQVLIRIPVKVWERITGGRKVRHVEIIVREDSLILKPHLLESRR